MSSLNIIRAWKDLDYRRGLTAEQRALVPAHPSGNIEFRPEEFQADLLRPSNGGCFSPCHKCFSGG
jgi:mersacidin/lichenicidin family type 2 lantibiotic